MTHSILSAQQRLAASRQAIVRDMHRKGAEADTPVPGDADANTHISETGMDTSSSSWDLVQQVARSWWQSHPAHLALDVARPMMQNYAQDQPVKLLGIAAATGAAFVVLRPWRLVSLTGVALTLLKSTQVSGVVRSFLHGDRPQDRR